MGQDVTKERSMSEKIEKQTIVVELGPGQHIREDGRIVHTDMSGSVLKTEDGDVKDIVCFISPGWMRKLADSSDESVV
jgi:hypothetical protein